jgi:hypothetical protein
VSGVILDIRRICRVEFVYSESYYSLRRKAASSLASYFISLRASAMTDRDDEGKNRSERVSEGVMRSRQTGNERSYTTDSLQFRINY